MRFFRTLAVLALSALFAGCGGATAVSAAPEPAATTSVTIYAKGARGDASPERMIAGPQTELHFPSAVAVDARGNRYVANRAGNSITIYDGRARGDAAPVRIIAGARTGLNLPTGLALDSQDNVYVANRSGDAIAVFAPGAGGNATPVRTIVGPSTQLDGPTSIAVNDESIYVTNLGNGSVTLFRRGANGNVAPIRIIRGKLTKLTAAFAITVDRAGRIYVVNSDDRHVSGILIFTPRASGNAAPARIIAGSATKLETPSGVAVDGSGAIFVSDHGGESSAGTLRVFAKDANGNAAPVYSIAGSATRLRPYGLTIDRGGQINVVNQTDR